MVNDKCSKAKLDKCINKVTGHQVQHYGLEAEYKGSVSVPIWFHAIRLLKIITLEYISHG